MSFLYYSYVGDFSMEDVVTPRRAKRALFLAKKKLTENRHEIKKLREKSRRQKQKIGSLSSLLNELREKTNLSETASDVLLVREIKKKSIDPLKGHLNDINNIEKKI